MPFRSLFSVNRDARNVALSVCLVALGTACGGNEPATVESGKAPGGDGPGPGGPGRGGGRTLDPVTVAVESATSGPIADYYSATATLQSLREATILARVSGVILDTYVEAGDSVSVGDPLIRVEDDEYRLRVRQSRAEKDRLQSKYDRAKRMAAGEFIAAEEVEVSEHELESAKASLALAELEFSHTKVLAPFSGRVVRRIVDAGQTVSNGSELFMLADLSRLRADVHVPAREFRAIHAGQRVELILDSTRERLDGTIDRVSPVIDTNSGTVRVTVDIARYPPGTRPGDFVEVRIVTDEHAEAVLVPRGATMGDGSDVVVYVASPDSVAVRRVVDVGYEDDAHSEILSGVEPGEWIVIQGQRGLKPKTPLTILPALDFGNENGLSPAAGN